MDYIHAANIVATHGFSGEIIVKHILGKKSSFTNVQALFLEQHAGVYLPHFISHAKAKSIDETLVKLEDVNTKEDAAKLLKKKVWLTATDFEKQASKTTPVYLVGFTAWQHNKQLGIIEQVIEQPHQVLLQTTIQHKEVLLPLHSETLEKIDYKNKKVHLQLPEGLLEIYLNN